MYSSSSDEDGEGVRDKSSEESKGLFFRNRSNFSSSAMGITPAGQSLITSLRVINNKRHLKDIPGVSHHEFSSELGGGTKTGQLHQWLDE